MIDENAVKRRDWVKNAAIVFLVIMLLLTFFSNTIMNYSLPEVAVQYAGSGDISEQIRGSGTVEASEVYHVTIGESRTVASIRVKEGDVVEKGQELIIFEDIDSTELTAAKDALDSLNYEYQKMLLATGEDYTLKYLEVKNKEDDIAAAKTKLEADRKNIPVYQDAYEKAKKNTEAKKELARALEKEVAALEEQLSAVSSDSDYVFLTAADLKLIEDAEKKLADAEKAKAKADKEVKDYEALVASENTSQQTLIDLREAIEKQENQIIYLYTAYLGVLYDGSIEDIALADKNIKDAESTLKYLQEEYNSAMSKAGNATRYANQLKSALQRQTSANDKYEAAQKNLTIVKGNIRKGLKINLSAAKDKYADAAEALKEAEAEEAEAKEKASLTIEEAEDAVTNLERELETMKATLSETQRKDAESSGVAALDIKAKQDAIKKQEDLIKKLTENSVGAKITADVGGTIRSIDCAAGLDTKPDTPLITIDVTELGYTLSFTVSNEQAQKIKVGDLAEVQYFWYGNAEARIQSIKPDASDPAKYKLVTFSIKGDVTPGQNLQLVMGAQKQSYEIILPNNSIREDNNGKFVLAVVSKPSPLGNRFVAERIDIEVLATDGTRTAVSGALSRNEYIITTATKPISPGEQVRISG